MDTTTVYYNFLYFILQRFVSALTGVDHVETKETHIMIPYSEETNHPFDKTMINTATLYNYFETTTVHLYFL